MPNCPGCHPTPAVISAATTNVELLGAVGLAGVLALSVPALRALLGYCDDESGTEDA